MKIRPIKNNRDYREALKEIDRLMVARPNTPEGDRLDVLVTLVEAWEEKHWPIDSPDPVEAILFAMEHRGDDSSSPQRVRYSGRSANRRKRRRMTRRTYGVLYRSTRVCPCPSRKCHPRFNYLYLRLPILYEPFLSQSPESRRTLATASLSLLRAKNYLY